jgi:hypothetical protein
VAHRRQRFAQKTIGSACVSPIQQHKVDQPAMLVNSSEQVLSAATDLHICLVHPPGGRAVALIPADPLLQFRRVTMDLAHDRRWFYLDTALLHHLRQFAIADPVLAVPANTHQDDERSSKGRTGHSATSLQRAVPCTPLARQRCRAVCPPRRGKGGIRRQGMAQHQRLNRRGGCKRVARFEVLKLVLAGLWRSAARQHSIYRCPVIPFWRATLT